MNGSAAPAPDATTAKAANDKAAAVQNLILWKPFISRAGVPTCIPDPNGKFVAKADYDALLSKLNAEDTALAQQKAKDEKIATDAAS